MNWTYLQAVMVLIYGAATSRSALSKVISFFLFLFAFMLIRIITNFIDFTGLAMSMQKKW